LKNLARSAYLVAAMLAFFSASPALGAGDYGLEPDEVAPGVFVFWGLNEPQLPSNGARIANDGFIVGADGVLVIDSGSSRLYGEQMLAAITQVTDLPIRTVVITHHHFDHAFGMPVFTERGIETVMHEDAARTLALEGEAILELMVERIGSEWTNGTVIGVPSRTISASEDVDLGERLVTITAFGGGHTAGDLTVTDQATGTLFAGDLVFAGRPSSVPHANIPLWLEQLDTIAALPWQRLVPGHGSMLTDAGELRPIRGYLAFLLDHTACSYRQGDSAVEALSPVMPSEYGDLAMIDIEFQRSVFQLFREYEVSGPPRCDR
jgi:uncharacterized sulfatase